MSKEESILNDVKDYYGILFNVFILREFRKVFFCKRLVRLPVLCTNKVFLYVEVTIIIKSNEDFFLKE